MEINESPILPESKSKRYDKIKVCWLINGNELPPTTTFEEVVSYCDSNGSIKIWQIGGMVSIQLDKLLYYKCVYGEGSAKTIKEIDLNPTSN